MSSVLMAGCGLRGRNLLPMVATGSEAPRKRSMPNARDGRASMAKWLRGLAGEAGASEIRFACEASQQGFGLCGEPAGAGVAASGEAGQRAQARGRRGCVRKLAVAMRHRALQASG